VRYCSYPRRVVGCDCLAAQARGEDGGTETEGRRVVGCAEDLGGELEVLVGKGGH
jgi:hypothetical protein